MASLALARITETYTDSEDEDFSSDINDSPVVMKVPEAPKPRTTAILVDYCAQDDTITSDEEEFSTPIDNSSKNTTTNVSLPEEEPTITTPFLDIELPPEPTGQCSKELTDKIVELTKKMEESGCDMNQIIQQRKSFRNPSIYEKLIDYCNINEFGTNYEPHIYDPFKWGKSSYYDELEKLQKEHIDKKIKEHRERTRSNVQTGTAKKITTQGSAVVEAGTKKRKSKWDQIVYPQGCAHVQTGTKGMNFPAFSSLPKKVKV